MTEQPQQVTEQSPPWPGHHHDAVTHDHPHFHVTHNWIERVGAFEHLAYQHAHEHAHGAESHSHYPHVDFEREHLGEAHDHEHSPAGDAQAPPSKPAAKRATKKSAEPAKKKSAEPAKKSSPRKRSVPQVEPTTSKQPGG